MNEIQAEHLQDIIAEGQRMRGDEDSREVARQAEEDAARKNRYAEEWAEFLEPIHFQLPAWMHQYITYDKDQSPYRGGRSPVIFLTDVPGMVNIRIRDQSGTIWYSPVQIVGIEDIDGSVFYKNNISDERTDYRIAFAIAAEHYHQKVEFDKQKAQLEQEIEDRQKQPEPTKEPKPRTATVDLSECDLDDFDGDQLLQMAILEQLQRIAKVLEGLDQHGIDVFQPKD